MRHVLQANSVSTVTFGVGEATIPTLLVASAGLMLRGLAGNTATAAPAVNLPMIATAADDHPNIASNAEKGSAWILISIRANENKLWTTASIGTMIFWHPCTARWQARYRKSLAVCSVPCLYFYDAISLLGISGHVTFGQALQTDHLEPSSKYGAAAWA
jgi:hypothetical protein